MTKRTSCPSRSGPGARRAPGARERGARAPSETGGQPSRVRHGLRRSDQGRFGRDHVGRDHFGRDHFGRDRVGRDRGALTLSYVIIVPFFLMSLMVIAQASVWYLARETALAAARQGADVARTANPPPGAGAQAAVSFARSAAPGFLLGPSASAAGSSATTVMITVSGRVPSLVPGMAITVSEVVTAPVERFTAVGPLARGRPDGR